MLLPIVSDLAQELDALDPSAVRRFFGLLRPSHLGEGSEITGAHGRSRQVTGGEEATQRTLASSALLLRSSRCRFISSTRSTQSDF